MPASLPPRLSRGKIWQGFPPSEVSYGLDSMN